VLALLLGSCLLLPGDEGSARIRGYDALALPGQELTLTAKLETAGPSGAAPDIRGAMLRFRLPRGNVLDGRTDGDGKARVVALAPTEPGDHVVELGLDPESPWSAAPATLLLRIRRAGEPFLVVDLDGTVTDASAATVLFGSPEPFPLAAEVLRELSRERAILYLTARDDALLPRTRRFLAEHGFPLAPVLTGDYRLGELSAERMKREALAKLRGSFTGDWVGVGDRPEDARAYLSVGMRALLVVPEGDPEELPEGAEPVRDWSEVRERIATRAEPDSGREGS
jgi:hypothetical protein